MLPWPNIGARLRLWLFLLTFSIESTVCQLDNGTCLDGDCGPSTINPVQLSTMNEPGISGTSEITTTPSEGTSSSFASTTELFTSTRDSKDQTSSPNKVSPPTVAPVVKPPVRSRRIKASNRTHPFGDLCPCDLLVGSCDPNCCCDVLDCSEEEKQAFSNCLPLPSAVPDPRLCHQYQWTSTPNHTVELQITDTHRQSLLCISRDNNPSRLALADYSPARSLEDFQELIGKRKVFRWATFPPRTVSFSGNSSYKVGDVLWTVQESSLLPLELMSSGFNSLCQSKKMVRFLENWKSSCVVPLPFVEEEREGEARSSQQRAVLEQKCSALGAEAVFRNLVILSSPLQWPNSSSSSHVCPPEVCIRAQQWVCHSPDFDDCVEGEDFPRSVLQGDVCINVLMAVRLVVDVLGVNIHSAQAYFVLSNVSFSGVDAAISRGHSIFFKWWSAEEDIGAEYDKDRIVWKRSGSPGYITGAPVMAGWKETVVLGGEDLKQREGGVEGGGVLEAIRVTPHAGGWLTMLGPVAGTHTCGGPRKAVQFRHSARWSCSIPVFSVDFTASGCAALKKKVLSLLLGLDSMGNLSERFVAMFGDSAPERLSEWLPLRMVSHDGKELSDVALQDGRGEGSSSDPRGMRCSGLQSDVHLEIATALVGSVGNPQAKVLGAVLRMGPTVDLRSHKVRLAGKGGGGGSSPVNMTAGGVVEAKQGRGEPVLHLMLVSSVTFVDVTTPPVMEVAPPPVYHIRLPHNFFHPFLSSVAPSLGKPCVAALMLTSVLSVVR